jgi:hypothetical protein
MPTVLPFRRIYTLFLLGLTAGLLTGCDGLHSPPDAAPVNVGRMPDYDRVEPARLPENLRSAFQRPGTWAFDESAGLTCRDGSTTGLGVRLQADDAPSRPGRFSPPDRISDDLVVFLEGGGACFNALTCSQNRAKFSREDFFDLPFIDGSSGLFDDSRPENPVSDWNFVFVPYCTGDEHVGSTESGTVPGLDVNYDGQPDLPGLVDQRFVGYENIGRTLDYIERHLGRDFDRILLTGSSAGGVGALGNFAQVAARFPRSQMTLLNDSGPVFYDDALLTPALQELWRTTWDLSEALPPGSARKTDVLQDIYGYAARSEPRASLGFLSYEQDFTIRFFYSFGQALTDPACGQTLYGGLLPDPNDPMSTPQRNACIGGADYKAALYDLRSEIQMEPPRASRWVTFYTSEPDPRLHTFLRDDRFYQATAGGQSLGAWVEDLIDGTAEDRGRHE